MAALIWTTLWVGIAAADSGTSRVSSSLASSFGIADKSDNLIVKLGDTFRLHCRASEPPYLCGWSPPPLGADQVHCDRVAKNNWVPSCADHPRVKYQTLHGDPSDLLTMCQITVIEAELADSGHWRCHLKQRPRLGDHADAVVAVKVAAPFQLSMLHHSAGPDVLNVTDSEEVVCAAKGEGDVLPELHWAVAGQQFADGHPSTRSWREIHSNGQTIVYLSLSVDRRKMAKALPDLDVLLLRCVSRQLYPDGSVIYERSVSTDIRLLREQDASHRAEQRQDGSLIAPVVTGIVAFALFLTVALVCWSKTNQVQRWCFQPRPKVQETKNTLERADQPSDDLLGDWHRGDGTGDRCTV